MRLDFIPLGNLSVDRTNMRRGRKMPDVADLLPTVRKRGILQTLLVRPGGEAGTFEIVAGRRRYHAACLVAAERQAAANDDDGPDPDDTMLPCAILDAGDDADAVEASMIENMARLDADEVTQWEAFTRLVREGRSVGEIGLTFGLPDLTVRRVLALGDLLPRIRAMYAKEGIDRVTVRQLTLASKRQQREWLRLVDDPVQRAPTGQQLRAWLLGGQSVPVAFALFDVEASGLATVADLFGEDPCFADAAAFWTAQDAAVAARRDAYLAQGWGEVVIVPRSEHFHSWKVEKRPKRKGGRVYIDVRATGEVAFHEGYVSLREAAKADRAEAAPGEKPTRPELTMALQTYVDLHRHAAVHAALTGHTQVALRLMVAHVIAGSSLWTVRREPQAAREGATQESVETSRAETVFDERRRAVLALLDMDPERPTVTGSSGDDCRLARLFLRLLELPDAALGDVITVAMGETLAAGGAAIEAVGQVVGLDMAVWWQADPALFTLIRDKELLGAMVAEVAGKTVAAANAKEKGATLKRILSDHLAGTGGRPKVEGWVPRWMRFPPSAYTERGGVGTVRACAALAAIARPDAEPDCDLDPAEPDAVLPMAADGRSGKTGAVNDIVVPEVAA